MMFTYVGGKDTDGTPMPSVVTQFGHDFHINKAVDVTDPHAIRKLKGMGKFFKEGGAPAKLTPPPPMPPPNPPVRHNP